MGTAVETTSLPIDQCSMEASLQAEDAAGEVVQAMTAIVAYRVGSNRNGRAPAEVWAVPASEARCSSIVMAAAVVADTAVLGLQPLEGQKTPAPSGRLAAEHCIRLRDTPVQARDAASHTEVPLQGSLPSLPQQADRQAEAW